MNVPKVSLSWGLWCPKHLKPLAADWPAHAAPAMVGLFNAAMRDERVIAEALHDANLIDSALRTLSPICCLVGDEIMHMVIGYAKEGQVFNGVDGPIEPRT